MRDSLGKDYVMKSKLGTLLLLLTVGIVGAAYSASGSLYDFKVNSLEGKPVELSQYRGKVTLVVNVASHCGYTPQYDGLEKLYKEYQSQGLVILGFPCNDFGGQEPGSPQEIQKFCSTKYNVTFPLFEKVSTKEGPGQAPVYQFLTAGGDKPSWNFCKYLIDRQGHIVKFFPSKVTPDAGELRAAIDGELAKK
jgi:glutathione peroxidase